MANLLPRIATGIPELDSVLYSGIPERSIVVIAGESGSGKTVLTLQMLFDAARHKKNSLYFTTLSEPPFKVIRYMQLFDFFDEKLMAEHITMADLGSILRHQGAEPALAAMIERVETEEPAIVVIDSFKAIHDMIEPGRQRSFVYDLAVSMTGWGATTFLVGEYNDADMVSLPELAVADGIVRLRAERSELAMVRQLEVHKLRGSQFVTGTHFFDIDTSGIRFYPRVRTPLATAPSPSPAGRVRTGAAGLDELLDGGLPRASTTFVIGGTGTGKTILGLTFLLEGARNGEPGVLLALEEGPDQIRETARAFGWDLAKFERQGLLSLLYASPVELSTDRFLHDALAAIARIGARRVVLDSLTSLALGISERRLKELVYALAKHLRAAGVTAMASMEVAELLGSARISGYGLSFAADNLIFMRYLEIAGRLDRAVAIIKARGVAHSPVLHELLIDDQGIRVGGPLQQLQGVLTGLPATRNESISR